MSFNSEPDMRPPANKGLKVFLLIVGIVVILTCAVLASVGISMAVMDARGSLPFATEPGVKPDPLVQSPTPDYIAGMETLSVREVVAKVKPSVVAIVATVPTGIGTGSGIIMSEDGYIITNAHVVNGATAITVVLDDETKTEYSADIVGLDTATDVAVIKVRGASGLTPAEFGDSDKLAEGDLVVAIGNPRGLELQGTTTVGYISAINRDLTLSNGRTVTMLQTDAAINTGNSGGPLVNEYGQVIGINSRKFSPSMYEGLGFAIPINIAAPIVNDLLDQGFVSGRPSIGITGGTAYNMDIPVGVLVQSVNEGSDAKSKGLMPGDLIVAINDIMVSTMDELNVEKEKCAVGDTLKITVVRENMQINFEVILGEMTS